MAAPAAALREVLSLIDRIVKEAVSVTDSGHTAFVPRYQLEQLAEARPALLSALEDARRLDWLDANGFTAYRDIDPIDGLSDHCVVVRETQKPRRGNVADTIRAAIDAAIAEGGQE